MCLGALLGNPATPVYTEPGALVSSDKLPQAHLQQYPRGSQDMQGGPVHLHFSTPKTPAHSRMVSPSKCGISTHHCVACWHRTEGDGQPEPSATRAQRTLKGGQISHTCRHPCWSVGGPSLKTGTSVTEPTALCKGLPRPACFLIRKWE